MIRPIKQLVIVLIYIILLALLSLVVYFFLKPKPSCLDGKMNQGETGVDCGGPCAECQKIIQLKSLVVKTVESIDLGNNHYDLIAKIYNPNNNYGSAKFSFRFVSVKGEATDWQTGFILPGETKNLVMLNSPLVTMGEKINIEIDQKHSNWERFIHYTEPRFTLINKVLDKEYKGEKQFFVAKGTLFNQSQIDFEKVKIKVFLRSKEGKLLAVNTQSMNTVRAGEKRDYFITFNQEIKNEVVTMAVEAETNIFDSDNYSRVYGSPQVVNWQ